MVVGVVADQLASFAQRACDLGVRVEDVLSGPVGDLRGEAPGIVHRNNQLDPRCLAGDLVVLTEPRSEVHDSGAVVVAHPVGHQHAEGVGMTGEEVEQGCVVELRQVGTAQARQHLVVSTQLRCVLLEGTRTDEHHTTVALSACGANQQVLHLCPDGQREVRGQRPRRGGPGPDLDVAAPSGPGQGRVIGRVDGECDGESRILARTGGVVETDLEVRQRRLCSPRIGHDAVGLVDQPLVVELFERPDDRLHVVDIHGLVVVVEVDPARLTGDVSLPLAGVAHHRRTALVVEALDAVVGDADPTGHPQFLFDVHLGG